MAIIAVLVFVSNVYASQSAITEAEGSACMGDDRSRKQTERAALTDAKKKAVEYVATYVRSETHIKNFELEKDLLTAYTHAEVKIIQEMEKCWYKDASSGECLKTRIKAEIIPDTKAIAGSTMNAQFADEPSAPLRVKVWSDKKEYKPGEKIKIYIKGNKPFFARVLYKDAGGTTIQLLPNPFRMDSYFNGGTVYEVPAGNDRFDLEVSPPFGEENIIIYASSTPLGEIGVETQGGVYKVKTSTRDIGTMTRGVKLLKKMESDPAHAAASEFYEDEVVVKTGR